MRAILRTLCGCSRIIRIEAVLPEIKLPMQLPPGTFLSMDVDPTTAMFKARTFALRAIYGDEVEYLETE